jgi:Wadjet protein JetD, C-terminal
VSGDPIESVRAQLATDGALRAVVTAILDRCDCRGNLPKQMALRCRTREEHEAAERLLSAAAVRPLRHGRAVRLDLARADASLRTEGWPGLSEVLYAAADRAPRNLRAEAVALAEHAAERALTLAEWQRGAAALFLRAQAERLATCRGELFELARAKGVARVEVELAVMARCIELAERNDQPVRLANFARRATGSTKGLRAGARRYARVTDALLRHLPGLAEKVAAEGPREPTDRRRLALECLGIFRNETPIDVLCYGHIVLEKQGHRFDAAALHHALGEPCRMLLLHLRGARIVAMRAERVVSIENETTFNDYVEWLRARGRDEIVLLSEGQANWAVVQFLRMLAAAVPGVPLVHWGDLDRFGVLILRSLRQRTGLRVEPWWMDVPTFERFAHAGLPLPDGELEEIDSLLAEPSAAVGTDLLGAIRGAKRWVEQETVAEELLGLREGVR